jgi:tetratricopeptide (TPR) repeat protein
MSEAENTRQRKGAKEQNLTTPQALDLAVGHYNAGRLPEAENLFQQIVRADPNQPVALHLLGAIASRVGKDDIAVDFIARALAIRPDYADAHNNLGVILRKLGKLDEAVGSYRAALALKPEFAGAHNNLGNALRDLGKLDEAGASFRKALSLIPDYAEAHDNLAKVLQDLGRLDEALASCQKALALKPGYADAHNSLGNALHDLGRRDEAVASYHKALALNPDYAEAHGNLGVALQDLGRLDEAAASFRKALAIKPDYARGHYNLGFALLATGRLEEGLDEHEWRWRTAQFPSRQRCFSKPRWDGNASLEGRTILVWGEQGPQDMATWSCRLAQVSERAGHCIVECPPKLVPLFARSFPPVEVRPETGNSDVEPDDFDVHLPMGSLFRHCPAGLAEASPEKAFLIPDPHRVTFWKKRLAQLGSGPFVGISWKSPLMTPRRSPNYTELADWTPVFAHGEAVFVNLQCKDHEDDIDAAGRDLGVRIHDFKDLDLYDDLDDVAALAGALDVVISVSTAVAAITAGIGTPTWVAAWRQSCWNNVLLAPRGPCVRFFERDTDEPWDGVFAAIAERLGARDF